MNGRIRHHTLACSVGVLLLAVGFPVDRVADQRPTFQSQVEVVAINVVVTDHQGQMVTNLNADAFQISEDNRPQRITQFTRDPLPLSIAVALDTSASMRIGGRFRYAQEA